MRLRLPPKQAFPHSVTYKAYTDEQDDWGKPEYKEPVNIEFVRIDEGYEFKQSGINSSDDMPNALIILFKKYNPDMPAFVNKGLVTYKENELTILKVIPLYFMSDEVIGYELEVK